MRISNIGSFIKSHGKSKIHSTRRDSIAQAPVGYLASQPASYAHRPHLTHIQQQWQKKAKPITLRYF